MTTNAATSTLRVTEIYPSIQGESTWAGIPCVFVRLTGCPLRCVWCDTVYAFTEGQRQSIDAIVDEVRSHGIPLVEVTGGEPLVQPECGDLCQRLLDAGFTVLLETSGAYDIDLVPRDVVRIMDLKCPDSGEEHRNLWSNIDRLQPHDEVKFVIASRRDFDWATEMTLAHRLPERVKAVLFSPVFGDIDLQDLARWITEARLPVRMQLQMHKYIWDPTAKGV